MCPKIKKLILPDNILSIEEAAFFNCPNLRSIEWQGRIFKDPDSFNKAIRLAGLPPVKAWFNS